MQNKKQHFHRNNFEFYLNEKNEFQKSIKILFFFYILLRISCAGNSASFDVNQSRSSNFTSSLSCNGKTLTKKLRLRRILTIENRNKSLKFLLFLFI